MKGRREFNALRSYLLRSPDDPEFATSLRLFFQRLRRHGARFEDFVHWAATADGRRGQRTRSKGAEERRHQLQRDIQRLKAQLRAAQERGAQGLGAVDVEALRRHIRVLQGDNDQLHRALDRAKSQGRWHLWRLGAAIFLGVSLGILWQWTHRGPALREPHYYPTAVADQGPINPLLPASPNPSPGEIAGGRAGIYRVRSERLAGYALANAPTPELWLHRDSCLEVVTHPLQGRWLAKVHLPQGLFLEVFVESQGLVAVESDPRGRCRVTLEW